MKGLFLCNRNLKTYYHLDPVFDSESDATWQATSSSLYSSAVLRHIDSSSNTIHHYAFLTGDDHSGAIGIAWLNSACLRSTAGKHKIFEVSVSKGLKKSEQV